MGILKTHIVQDIQEAIEAHAKAEVRHATKNWGHGL